MEAQSVRIMKDIHGWDVLDALVRLLRPLLSLTDTFGGSEYVTSSRVRKHIACSSNLTETLLQTVPLIMAAMEQTEKIYNNQKSFDERM